MKTTIALIALTSAITATDALAADSDKIQQLEKRIAELENSLNTVADAVESTNANQRSSKVHIGGYGELHYNNLDVNGSDHQELDLHRIVFFIGYDFNDKIRLVTETEIEHAIAGDGKRGEVEIEQAYVEIDLKENMHFRSGMMLMPIGIINETHEPNTFYGVERPIIESTIIPSTWYVTGASFNHQFNNGFSYDLLITEGLKTADPTADPNADPFNLKGGKQKGSKAAAYDLATTARIVYRGIAGFEAAAYLQYQPDLDQSAEISYADSATLAGGHVIYQWNKLTAKALYTRWDLDGDAAANAGKAVQDGGYLEAGWKANRQWGVFVRQSTWSQQQDINATQTDFGVNYTPIDNVVFKVDYQIQNDDAGDAKGFNLGVGYQF